MVETVAPSAWEKSIVRRMSTPCGDIAALMDLYELTCGAAWAYARHYTSRPKARAAVLGAYLTAWETPETLVDLRVPLRLRVCMLVHLQLVQDDRRAPRRFGSQVLDKIINKSNRNLTIRGSGHVE